MMTVAEKMDVQLDKLAANGFTFNEQEGAFIYFIPVMYNQDSNTIAESSITGYLKKLKWIDRQTRQVRVRMAVYNGNYMLFGIVEVKFEFGLGGLLAKGVDVSVLDLEAYNFYTSKDELIFRRVFRLFLELIVVAGVIFKVIGEVEDMIEARKLHGTVRAYFEPWNILDVVGIAMYSIVIVYWIIYFFQMEAVDIPKTEPLKESRPKGCVPASPSTIETDCPLQALDWAHPDFLGDLLDMTNNMMAAKSSFTYYKLFSSMNLFVTLALFFKFARHQERLAIVNKTFIYAMPDLLHFFCIFFVVIMFFVTAARVIFGADWVEYTTFGGSFLTFFSMTLNGAGVADMSATADSVHTVTTSAVIFWLIFKVLIFMIILNMFLGILIGAYDTAAEEAGDAPSLPESLTIELNRRYKKWKKANKAKAGNDVKQMDGDVEDQEVDDEIEDDTLGSLREINIEYRTAAGKEKARQGISQLQLRKMLDDHEVPESQIDYLFSKYINHEEEDDAGEEGDDDDYDAFEEAERMEEAEKKKGMSVQCGGVGMNIALLDKDGDGILDTEERQIEAQEKLEELATMISQRDKALEKRETETSARAEKIQADVVEMKRMLQALVTGAKPS